MTSLQNRHHFRPLIALVGLALSQNPVHAAPNSPPQFQPSAPAQLQKRAPNTPFSCERKILYRGQTFNCDSSLEQDGERLRPILNQTPAALSELALYQQGRRDIQRYAWIGTGGFAVAFGGWLLSKQFSGTEQNTVRSASIITGVGAIGFALGAGLIQLQKNEEHLKAAIQIHNSQHPEDSIEIQFTTGLSIQ